VHGDRLVRDRGVRVLALGGSGAFGAQAARLLAADRRVTEVVIGCRDVARGEAVAATLHGKGSVERVDIEDGRLPACDVVMSAAGPAYRYARRAVAAAVAAGRPYVDLCDDAAAATAAFELDEAARAAGVTAVLGLGCSPGVTNLTAARAARVLDEVEAVHVLHGGTAEASLGGVANLMHMLDLIDGDVPVVENGELTTARGFAELEPHDFGPPLGVVRTGLIAHPEPVMFARSFPGLRSASVRLGLAPEIANDLLAASAYFGLTSERPTTVGGRAVVPREFLAEHLHRYLEERAGGSEAVPFAVQVVVEGRRAGGCVRLVYRTFEDVALLIGAALALGAIQLVERRIDDPGVRTPEQCVDAEAFLAELQTFGVRGPQLEEEKIPVTTSGG
jgi:saccharopine dehydrogenase-like NADP-dependent oxidoreductase